MQFGSAVGEACLSFILTNIDATFVLVTFFSESKTSNSLTPTKIVVGQYIGFSIIVGISLIGYAAAAGLPAEPIGFLGLLPLVLGVWKGLRVLFPKDDDEEAEAESQCIANAKTVFKIVSITVMNGGDNIGTYAPLFSRAEGAAIAIFMLAYYILLGLLCLITFLIMKRRHIVYVAERYASLIIPFLYIGLGIYVIVTSECFPWTIRKINDRFISNPGKIIMGIVTSFTLFIVIATMVWIRKNKQNKSLFSRRELSLATVGSNNSKRKESDYHPDSLANASETNHIVIGQTEDNCERVGRASKIERNGISEQSETKVKTQPQDPTKDDEMQKAK